MVALVIVLAVIGAVLVIVGALLAYFGGTRPVKDKPGLYTIPRYRGVALSIAIAGAIVALAATLVGLNL
ncbi:hypothetical protein [Agromyces sp. ZXT2-6]|uniref:hypothetical protein n=1 Tax=Agromyces sp. ZXT2-6 TaxID=3461153 RepID=UPI0040552CD9